MLFLACQIYQYDTLPSDFVVSDLYCEAGGREFDSTTGQIIDW